ncbi:LOW QUALITY PROTEIN: LRR domain containing protein [Trema orientale]|uniref:LRR domain containing protein n=1 Tax=Trema orientale TaxID=63057 RepID=A0A2P5EIA9_TREOI|nr:LOW QUALITY PROTEIN: LRR domain containing protein [Trema orientale]
MDLHECLTDWMKGLTSLKTLHIENNHKLKYLSPGIQYLTSLQELCTDDCEKLIEISLGDSIKWEALTCDSPGLQRPTILQRLTIMNCQNLMALPDWICKLCSFKALDLLYCQNLKSLPGSISGYTSLRSLQIYGCQPLVRKMSKIIRRGLA